MSKNLPQKSQFIIYQTESGETKIDVRIRNIYEDQELDPKSTVKEFLTVQQEGAREE